MQLGNISFLSNTQNQTPISHGLGVYWTLNEGTGSVFRDYSGNNLSYGEPVIGNAAIWIESPNGKGVMFDRSYALQSNFIPSGSMIDFNSGSNCTFCWWMNVSGYPEPAVLIEMGLTSGWGIESNNLGEIDIVSLQVSSDFQFPNMYTIDNLWHFYCVTYTPGTCNIYVDGNFASSSFGTTNWTGIQNDGPVFVMIGSSRGFDFVGSMTHISIYNRTLSAGEVAGLYHTTK